ncbi:Pheromone-processing carboxypeptidase KEX1 [Neolecta irregularis DAH-3]|uniref:Pheromone-processing carboxypeptidase KEX1 n=1 Tax=Neolecta irregularis (strain DAH-3) TaxID=1198029 RepID=A0A1U7LIW6_NEOID|nr:Pheromone-processing carboxypeptidase KEX1 [Neolecta irregularis DAH-3]|eukprot:OLL22568.1 Pheromone-processing carboxypeptidase KEX1 [Neolecta irregularis DAH-3]
MSLFGSSTTPAASATTTASPELASDFALADPPGDGITDLAFSPHADFLAVSSWDNNTRIYDIQPTGQSSGKALYSHEAAVFSTHWSFDGTKVASGGADKAARLFDLQSGQAQQVAAHDAPIRNVRFVNTPSGQCLATGSWDKTLKFWDLRQSQPAATLQLPERCYAMDAANQLLVVGTAEKKIVVVDLRSVQIHKTMDSPLKWQTRVVTCFPDASGFAVGSIEGRCGIQYIEDSKASGNFSFKCHRDSSPAGYSTSKQTLKVWSVNAISFHPQHGTFATAGSDGTINFWDKDSKHRLKGYNQSVGGPISATTFNRNGTIYAYAISYDWSQGYQKNSPSLPNKVMLHPTKDEEVKKKNGNKLFRITFEIFSSRPQTLNHIGILVTRLRLLLLLLSSLSFSFSKTASEYHVKSIPGQPPDFHPKMHAGHIELDATKNANLFFWSIENRHLADRPRTIIWLNGGPGCSSMDGALMEIGPFRTTSADELRENKYSWHQFAHLLFVDQPYGTGFSYINTDSYLHDLDEAASAFVDFLDKFMDLFPHFEDDDIYISGESYAGQYIPHFAKALLHRNESTSSHRKFNIKGLLIGNGWMDPKTQYPAYLSYSLQNGIIDNSTEGFAAINDKSTQCALSLENNFSISSPTCEAILTMILDATKTDENGKSMCTNFYDHRLKDDFPACGNNWPPDLANLVPYLRKDDVKSALHINADKKTGWVECAGGVTSTFKASNSRPSSELFPELLQQIPIVLFNGDKDIICNHIGIENMIHNMEWGSSKGLQDSAGVWAPRERWFIDTEEVGYWQYSKNLTNILFFNASHMVAFDYPDRALDMINRFMGVNVTSLSDHIKESTVGSNLNPLSLNTSPAPADSKNSTKLETVTQKAYSRAGSIALVVVIMAVGLLGWYIWRQAKRERGLWQHKRDRSGLMNEDDEINELDEFVSDSPIFDVDRRDSEQGQPRRF